MNASVTRVVLREQVKELILERILNGTYAPGERLVETRIASELGTSQAPVREALRDLELLRFVESEPFRGARVREVSEDELIEIYPVRAAIEEVAAREAAVRLDGRVEELEAELDAMRSAAERGSRGRGDGAPPRAGAGGAAGARPGAGGPGAAPPCRAIRRAAERGERM